MEGSTEQGTVRSWLRCYRCWSTNLEVQVHYEGIHKIDPETGERADVVDEMQEAVVQCLDCMHDQPHLGFHKHDEDKIVVHMLVELYARSIEEATEVLEVAARGPLSITALAEESRPPAASAEDVH